MLVYELGGIVDDVVNDNEDVLLGVVLGNVLVGVFLGHCERVFGGCAWLPRGRRWIAK